MDWLTNNFIGSMPGPDFLLFYGIYIVIVLVWCKTRLNRLNDDASPLPPIPAKPDPYEIAYLRGGAREVLWVALFNLQQQGYLRLSSDLTRLNSLEPTESVPTESLLPPVERIVYAEFAQSAASPHIYRAAAGRIETLCYEYRNRLMGQGLIASPEQLARKFAVGVKAFFAIAALGGYKLAAALSTGHSNVEFLIIMGAISSLIVVGMCASAPLNHRGKAYLERLNLAYGGLRGQAPSLITPGATNDDGLLMIGLFGMDVLADTAYAPFAGVYHASMPPVPPASGGGCSSCASVSSCNSGGGDSGGSSCSSGGGDSGGGGGCGGCGGGGGD